MASVSETDESELEDLLYGTEKQGTGNARDQHEYETLLPTKSRKAGLVVPLLAIVFLVLCLAASVVVVVILVLKPGTGGPSPDSPIGVWMLHNRNGSIHINATVPGNVHGALLDAHIIPDPYFRYNYISLRWVYQDTWTYAYRFNVSQEMTEKLHLVCEGLDTIASVNVNDINVGQASNQFLRYIFDITQHVKLGETNTLSIVFSPPVEYATQESSSSQVPVPPTCPPKEYHPECHPNMIRKSQAAFGSKWSPAILTQGIWRDIYMIEFSSCRILDILTKPFKDSQSTTWDLCISAFVDCVIQTNVTLSWTLIDDVTNVTIIDDVTSADIMLTLGENKIEQTLKNLPVASWWPRGHGEQKLYTLNVTLYRDGDAPDTKTVMTGFREVRLVQDEVDDGYSFYFEINRRPIFLKGSTWIPSDSLHGLVDNKRVEGLIHSTIEANMNVLRVPGRGVYETDYFYDLADKYGIMIWQDLMFSSALYPGTTKFTELVKREANYQLRRLVRHPSIIAWRGNEYIEQAITGKWYAMDGTYYEQYKDDYKTLFNKVLRDEVEDLTSVPYVLSGPSNGKLTMEEGGISQTVDPNSPQYGDIHSEQFLQDCMQIDNSSAPRFVSEYGWPSWPSYHSLLRVANKKDLVYGSDFFNQRNHNPQAAKGTDEMITRYFKFTNHMRTEEGFKHYIYLTQLVQALCLRAQTEHYRLMRKSGTMGAIWSQHNELWPAPSGATVEQDGTWKMAHYYAALAMSDVILTIQRKGNVITGYIANGITEDLYISTAHMDVYVWGNVDSVYGEDLIMEHGNLPAQMVTEIFSLDISTTNSYAYCVAQYGNESCYVNFYVLAPDKSVTVPPVDLYLRPFNQMKRLNPSSIRVDAVERMDESNFSIQIYCNTSSPFVWAEAKNIAGWFSVNGVTYNCEESGKTVNFHSLHPGVTNETLKQSLEFTSLADIMLGH